MKRTRRNQPFGQAVSPKQIAASGEHDAFGREASRLVAQGLSLAGSPLDAIIPRRSEQFLRRIEKFAVQIAIWGSRLNLTARPDDPQEVAFHVTDSLAPLIVGHQAGRDAAIGEAFAAGRTVLDVGSGAGFPGLVLAAANEAEFHLFESRRKRASFLAVASGEMGLRDVIVEARRAEASTFNHSSFDVVISRALGGQAEFFRFASAALRSSGLVLLYASAGQALELDEAAAAGLTCHRSLAYEVPRGSRRVHRTLAVWRKP